MAKRVIVEFICDVCARIVAIEHYSGNMNGHIAKVHPYPKGWRMGIGGEAIDVCPDCPIPEVEIIERGQ